MCSVHSLAWRCSWDKLTQPPCTPTCAVHLQSAVTQLHSAQQAAFTTAEALSYPAAKPQHPTPILSPLTPDQHHRPTTATATAAPAVPQRSPSLKFTCPAAPPTASPPCCCCSSRHAPRPCGAPATHCQPQGRAAPLLPVPVPLPLLLHLAALPVPAAQRHHDKQHSNISADCEQGHPSLASGHAEP